MVNAKPVNDVFAGKDHELLANRVHGDVGTDAVAPAGIPVRVKVVDAGRFVPEVGTIVSEYVAVPPGITVCDGPWPLTFPGFKLKSTLDWTWELVSEKLAKVAPEAAAVTV
jgi:hypothetical protein